MINIPHFLLTWKIMHYNILCTSSSTEPVVMVEGYSFEFPDFFFSVLWGNTGKESCI